MKKKFLHDGWIFITPITLFMLLMLGFPLLVDMYYSLSSLTFLTIRAPQWIGIGNYIEAFTDAKFWGSMGFSFKFGVIATILEVGIGLFLAMTLEPLIRRHRWLMAFILMPMMISPALLGMMYRLMLNDFVGLIPQYLGLFGWYPNLLGVDWVFFTVIMIEVLQWTPFAFLILLSGYQAIPTFLYEAARMDGANRWEMFRYIEIPMLLPAMAITLFIRFVDSFRVFDHIFVLTGGGPGTSTTSISIHIYKTFFQQEDLGLAIASSLILLLFAFTILYISMRFILRGNEK